MLFNRILIFPLIFLFGISSVRAQTLSGRAEVSLLTFGPGEEVYAIWGHTAIRINDPVLQIDKVYNYGTFDFDTPDFLLKFIRGKLNYALSQQRFNRVVQAYKQENRSITEQLMDFNQAEKQKLFTLLEENYLPKNRYYKYDFFFDNCATRPLEIIKKSTDTKLVFHNGEQKTFRNILDEHLHYDPWLDLGIDLIIGAKADRVTTPEQQMFTPIYFYKYFSTARFASENGNPVISAEREIFIPETEYRKTILFFLQPEFVFYSLFVLELILLITVYRKKKLWMKWYDLVWFIIFSLGSLLLLFLWFGTDHLATKLNWNLWWLNPIFLLLSIFFANRAMKWIARVNFVILCLFLLFFWILPQQFHAAIFPLAGIAMIKLFNYGFLQVGDSNPNNVIA